VTLPVEDELKLAAPAAFVLPDLAAGAGTAGGPAEASDPSGAGGLRAGRGTAEAGAAGSQSAGAAGTPGAGAAGTQSAGAAGTPGAGAAGTPGAGAAGTTGTAEVAPRTDGSEGTSGTGGAGVPGVADVRSEGRRTLQATYWDTPDLRLIRNGVTLRYRTGEDGPPWQIKLPLPASGPGVRREEIAEPGGPDSVPAKLAGLLTGWVRTAKLGPVARLRTERDVHKVLAGDGSELAELVDDSVSVLDGKRTLSRFRELELERRGADDVVLSGLRDQLVAAGAVEGEFTPKVVHALGPLATAPSDLPEPPRLSRRSSAGAVVAYSLATNLRRLISQHAPVRRGEDDAVHQMRVACRRLRSDLRTFRPVVDQAWAEGLRAELKWLAGSLGVARDLEVLRQRIADAADADPLAPLDEDAVSRVDAELESRERAALSEVDTALGSRRYAELLDRLVEAARHPVLTAAAGEPAEDVLRPLVARSWRKLKKGERRLAPDGADYDWHRVRILAKRARYAGEAVAPALGKPASRLAKAAESVQDLLGEHQDAAVAAETWLSIARSDPDDHSLAVTAGRLYERERSTIRTVRAKFPAAWAATTKRRMVEWLP
jgi:CHAD domain-containing protein